jgi:hypothetical protein
VPGATPAISANNQRTWRRGRYRSG